MNRFSSLLLPSLTLLLFPGGALAQRQSVPDGFVDERVLDGAGTDLEGLYALKFAPDGRMFFTQWRRGTIRVMTYDRSRDAWTLEPEPFHQFATPDSNPDSPTARRGTLRCFDFDPDFENNGLLYATYMHDEDRRGYRIVRIRQSEETPHRSDGSEEILLVCPFFADGDQPDAHNGGGVVVGGDGKLYVSFGDGWREPAATDLGGFAGKIVRLNRDGSIPRDNVWYDVLEGDRRAIVGVGQRNPTCLSRHPQSGAVYINGFTGEHKAGMFRLVQGAHYGHGGSCELGEPAAEWINTKEHNGGTTWACWYPAGGAWPEEYWHHAFAVNWMPNSGEIVRIGGEEQRPRRLPFAKGLVYRGPDGVPIGPVAAEIGPDGHLYYTVREYGEYADLRRIRYIGDRDSPIASAPPRAAPDAPMDRTPANEPQEEGDLAAFATAVEGGDAERGRTLFMENDGLACLKCHRFGNVGGDVGPPLTDIGGQRSREHLLESILFPEKEVDERYAQVNVATEDGRVVTGRVEAETEQRLVLITAEGVRAEIDKSTVEARRAAPSAMPSDYRERLRLQELRDLVEFLARARGG